MPAFFEDEDGKVIMYFAGRYPGFSPTGDTCASVQRDDDSFGPGVPVAELNTPGYHETAPTIRRDGLEIILSSTRPGGLGNYDLWRATRDSTRDPWSAPVRLDEAGVNTSGFEGGRMSQSFDGLTL